VKYAWIKEHIGEFPVAAMCRVLGVAVRRLTPGDRTPNANANLPTGTGNQDRPDRTRDARGYGSPRVTVELNARGTRVSEIRSHGA